MTSPTSARRHRGKLATITAAAVLAARRAWRQLRPGGNWQQQYEEQVGPQLLLLSAAAQTAAARESDEYVAAVLNELAFGPPTSPGVVRVPGFVGVMGDGRPVETLLEQTVVKAGRAYNTAVQAAGGEMTRQVPGTFDAERAAEQALASVESFVDTIFHEIVAETALAAESAATVEREWVGGWIRMVNPPSCSRCALLAGRFYLWNEGFERHPQCDCVHIPASEAAAGDLTTDPAAYFDSLSREEQDRIFTKAGAEAIRDGADISQVVNARRGMSVAQVAGRDVLVTTEGTTRRGLASRARTGRNMPARLMPETIYSAAPSREDAIRLLKVHGFIL